MKIILIGATGYTGSRICHEALTRGHDISAIVRDVSRIIAHPRLAPIVEAARRCKPMRLLVVGGAGRLEIEPGKRLLDQPDFPEQWKAGALIAAAFLDALRRRSSELSWTCISPAANLVPGTRTGSYRVGGDRLLTDSHRKRSISATVSWKTAAALSPSIPLMCRLLGC